jgi:hypothetical protein
MKESEMHRLLSRSSLAIVCLAFVILIAAAACATRAAPASPAPTASVVVATPAAATAPPGQSVPASATIAAEPPVAELAAEGGDPTEGQLGTFAWRDSGSDSPWLPGARMAVGAGEPLGVAFRPATIVATWAARSVPSTADGPAGATVLGEGAGQPRFEAPRAGTWTVEVHVVFEDGLGDASYFWQLAVSS